LWHGSRFHQGTQAPSTNKADSHNKEQYLSLAKRKSFNGIQNGHIYVIAKMSKSFRQK
jgi:hypothetical protein